MKNLWHKADIKRTFSVRRWLRLNVLLLVFTGLISVSFPVVSLSRKLGDFYFRARGTQPTSGKIALVLIDDSTLARYGRWPWPRRQLAQLIRSVSQLHPQAIGVDILLSEPEDEDERHKRPSMESNDSALESAIQEAHNLVLPTKISGSLSGSLWSDPLPRFSRAAAAVGHVQAVVDSDGICRRIPLSEPSAEGPRPAFALAVVNVANATAEKAAADKNFLPNRAVAIDRFETEYLTINYRQQFVPEKSMPPFLTLSAGDLLEGQKGKSLEGKIVLIGFGATELSDRLFTPVSSQSPMPGVEVNANAVDTILEHKQIVSLGMGMQLALLLGTSMLSLWIVMWWPGLRGLLYLFALLLAEYAAGYLLFSAYGKQVLYGPFLVADVFAAPLAQLENLIVIDRAITRRLRELRGLLPTRAESSPHKIIIPVHDAPPSHLHWKLESLHQLQEELASLYAFDETLLETMQEALAVYSPAGDLLFHNSSWQRFCEKQALPTTPNLQELALALGLGDEFPHLPLQSEAWQERELSFMDGSLWRFRGVRLPWPSGAQSGTIMLLLEDISARRQRDQARAEALGFVTHELRTPLMAIQGFAELLMYYPQTPGAIEAPAMIFRESQRLVAMINAYLEVLRMDVGRRPLRFKPVPVDDIVNHVRHILQPIAQAARIDIKVQIDSEGQFLNCDEALITGALLNLVSNAVKYSPARSTVTIETWVKDSEIEFMVHNPGPAIPAQELEHIFEPYYRASQQSDSKPGWGLGLAFVKRISEQHSGRVQVSSDASSGTCFRLILPIDLRIASEVST